MVLLAVVQLRDGAVDSLSGVSGSTSNLEVRVDSHETRFHFQAIVGRLDLTWERFTWQSVILVKLLDPQIVNQVFLACWLRNILGS